MKFESKFIHFHSRKCIWKHLHNDSHLSGPQCLHKDHPADQKPSLILIINQCGIENLVLSDMGLSTKSQVISNYSIDLVFQECLCIINRSRKLSTISLNILCFSCKEKPSGDQWWLWWWKSTVNSHYFGTFLLILSLIGTNLTNEGRVCSVF